MFTKKKQITKNNISVQEFPLSSGQLFTAQRVRAAITRQIMGQFLHTAELMKFMMADSAFSAAINKRVGGLIRTDLSIEAVDPTNPKEVEAAKLIQDNIGLLLPEIEFGKWLATFHCLSISPATLDWSYTNSLWIPKLRVLQPQWTQWLIGPDKWIHQTKEGMLDITPGDGRWCFLNAWHQGVPTGYVSQLGQDWAAKQFAIRDWTDWNEVCAWPFTKCYVPRGGVSPEESDQFVADVAVARQTKVIKLPRGKDESESYDVDSLATAPTGGHISFKELVEWVDRKYQVSILGGNLSSEVADAGGNRAAAVTHHGIERELAQGDAQLLSTVVPQQIFKPFIEANLGTGIQTPLPRWNTNVPEDSSSIGTALNSFADFLTKISNSGYEVANIIEIAKTFDIRLTKKV